MCLTHGGWWVSFVNEKLINNQSKKEMEDFIWAKLRIISQETVFQETPGTVPPDRGQGTVVQVFAMKYVKVTYWPLHSPGRVMSHCDPVQDWDRNHIS